MIKLIATDMDGTFLDSSKRFSMEFFDIFAELRKKGIKFVIASGNQYFRLYQKFLPISNEMYFIGENGSYIAKGAKLIATNMLKKEQVQAVIQLVESHPELNMILCGVKSAYCLNEFKHLEPVVRTYYCNYQFVESYDDIDDEIMKIAIYDPNHQIIRYADDIARGLDKGVKATTSGNEWIDIQNEDIEFEDIQNENENEDSLAHAGLNLSDSGNNQIKADEDGNYYSSSAILKFKDGAKISLSQWGLGKTELNLTKTTIISSVYKGGIIGRKQISLNPSVKIVIDTTEPTIELSDDEKTIWKTEADTAVDITGTAVDENLKKVVWSATELTPDDVVLNQKQEAVLNENGKFEISGIQLAENQNIDKIYIYAIDKANQCSEAGVITVYRDSAAPEITEVSLIPADTIKKYDFGNYYNANIKVKVTAKDVDVKDSKSGYPAVGVKEICVYSDDDKKVYTGTVSTQVSGTSDATIEVTIPLEEAGTFASLKEVHIKAVDALGNESKAYKLKEIKNHNGISSDVLMLEKDAPVVKGTPQADGKYENTKDGKTEYWYKEIPAIVCEVTDQKDQTNGSGLAARTVTVNGVELTSKAKNFVESITDSDQIVQEDSLTLSASDLQKVQEGENTVVTTYTDIAGNKTIDTKTICLDTHKPDVTRFNIEKKDASKILNIFTFGNYGNGVIKVTVTADDLQATGAWFRSTVSRTERNYIICR